MTGGGPITKHPFPRKEIFIQSSKAILRNYKVISRRLDSGKLTSRQKDLLLQEKSFKKSSMGGLTIRLYKQMIEVVYDYSQYGTFNPKPYVRSLKSLENLFRSF